MKDIVITRKTGGKPIQAGAFSTIRQALEDAVSKGISLRGADLRNATLRGANLDGADLREALLDGADLRDINLSEANLTRASLRDAEMTGACLCESRIIDVDFTGASFGNTLLTDAVIRNCTFNCPTALTLPFRTAKTGCNVFIHANGTKIEFTGTIVTILGLQNRIAILDDQVLLGEYIYDRETVEKCAKSMYQAMTEQIQ